MKILHIITSLSYGGAQETLYNIITNQKSPNINHIVLSIRGSSKYTTLIKNRNITCYDLNISKSKINLLPGFINLIKIIKYEKPNLIQSWMYHSDLLGSLASLITKTPIYWCLVNFSLDPKTTKLNTRITSKICSYLSYIVPKKIISCSSSASQYHIDRGYKHNIFVNIDLGITINKKNININKQNLSNTNFIIGCIGRWDPQKNHKNLIFAFNNIINKKNKKNFKLLLAGPNVDKNNIDLLKLVRDLKLEKYVKILGFVKNLDNFYSAIHLNILPSVGEAFPISLLESMIRKKIVIATNVGENSKILRNEDLIINSPNIIDIQNSIIKIYDKYSNKKWLNKIEESLQKIVIENYDIDNTVNLFEKEWLKN